MERPICLKGDWVAVKDEARIDNLMREKSSPKIGLMLIITPIPKFKHKSEQYTKKFTKVLGTP
jgi:hypothetical protein